MLELIIGAEGKGKTRVLINRANDDMKVTNGSLIYIDKSNKHMYELSNKIRLINTSDYKMINIDVFMGFLLGVISSNNDLERIYIDNFCLLNNIGQNLINECLERVDLIAEMFDLSIVISVSTTIDNISGKFREMIIAEL